MVDINAWAGIGDSSEAADRADAAWRRICEKPSEIAIIRSSGKVKSGVDAQTVRIEFDYPANYETAGEAGTSSKQAVTVFGIIGHDLETDTDIRRDDQFKYDGALYRVVTITKTIGEVQAKAEAMS